MWQTYLDHTFNKAINVLLNVVSNNRQSKSVDKQQSKHTDLLKVKINLMNSFIYNSASAICLQLFGVVSVRNNLIGLTQ